MTKPPSKAWGDIKDVKRVKLVAERKKKRLTQGQLANEIGVSTSLISHLENGRVKPTVDIALKLQEFYCSTHEELFPDF